MKKTDDPSEYYFYGQGSRLPTEDIATSTNKTTTVSNKKTENSNLKQITTAVFVSRLTGMQIFSALIIFMASILQVVSIVTTDWFVLNVNEYIPTSKGGLWNYCYISSSNFNGLVGQYSCLKYEELPNFAVFVNSRLYDSRILLVCSCGFSALILIIEIFGILALCLAEKKVDMFDSFVANRSNRRLNNQPESRNKGTKVNNELDETNNSARFTTSIIVNANLNERTYDNNNAYAIVSMHSSKPTGYYAYLAIALITLVGSVMDFVLKVSGFALFDSYIQNLLKFNTVFLAYRSFSYWMMITSIGLLIFFWLFKVFSTRYVINLTKQLIKNRELLFSKQDNDSLAYSSSPHSASQYQYDPFKTNYTTISRIQDELVNNYNDSSTYNVKYANGSKVLNNTTNFNESKQISSYPVKSSFVYDLDSNEDDLSSSFYSSKLQSINSNYFLDYLQQPFNNHIQMEDYLPAYNYTFNDTDNSLNNKQMFKRDKPENLSSNSVIRF